MRPDRSLTLVLTEPGRAQKRVVKVAFVPFTIGSDAHSDVPLGDTEKPVALQVIRRSGRFRIVRHVEVGSSESTRGAWLHNGINLHFAGVQLRFFTQPPAGGMLDARNAQIEVVTAPRNGDRDFETLTPSRRAPTRSIVAAYIPRALDAPPVTHHEPVPLVPQRVDPDEHLAKLDDLHKRLRKAKGPRFGRLRS